MAPKAVGAVPASALDSPEAEVVASLIVRDLHFPVGDGAPRGAGGMLLGSGMAMEVAFLAVSLMLLLVPCLAVEVTLLVVALVLVAVLVVAGVLLLVTVVAMEVPVLASVFLRVVAA